MILVSFPYPMISGPLISTFVRPLSLLIFILSSGCATQLDVQEEENEVRRQTIELEPTIISSVDSINITDLFDRAYSHFEQGRYSDAATDYQKIIDISKRVTVAPQYLLPSLYNAGLSYEKIERFDEATTCYQAILEQNIPLDDACDAYFRLAIVYETLKRWNDVANVMEQLLQKNELSANDQTEAHMRLGWALMESQSYNSALSHFQQALYINNKTPTMQRLGKYSTVMVQTHFGIGRIFQEKGEAIKLQLPPERMGKDLERKAEYLLSSQNAYLNALAAHHRKWSIAAGFKIGSLYENFYHDILSSEIPEGLSQESLTLYFAELRKHLKPLVERASRIYNKTISLSNRMGNPIDSASWSQIAKDSLKHMNKYIQDPATQQRTERFVERGWPLNQMFIPNMIVLDAALHAKDIANQKIDHSTVKSETSPSPQKTE